MWFTRESNSLFLRSTTVDVTQLSIKESQNKKTRTDKKGEDEVSMLIIYLFLEIGYFCHDCPKET